MESLIISRNQEKAYEILSHEFLFDEIIELEPDQYPKGAVKKAEGDGWSLWTTEGKNYAVVLGVGVFLLVQKHLPLDNQLY
jgi:hypothetical protein